jgi:hypothetical protein
MVSGHKIILISIQFNHLRIEKMAVMISSNDFKNPAG